MATAAGGTQEAGTVDKGAWEAELGHRLRTLRVAHQLTQRELADRANVSLGALKHLEQGSGATTTTLAKVLHALGQEDWVEALAPPSPEFSPLELLEQRRRAAGHGQKRVHHRSASR